MTTTGRRLFCLVGLLVVIGWPVAWADEITQLETSGVVVGQNEIYRLRTDLPERTVRRANWLDGEVTKTLTYQNQLYLIAVKDDKRRLWHTENGLKIRAVDQVSSSSELDMMVVGDLLWVYQAGSPNNLLRYNGQEWQDYQTPAQSSQALSQIYRLDSTWYLLNQSGEQLEVWVDRDSHFTLKQTYQCTLKQLLANSPAALCHDGQLINLATQETTITNVPSLVVSNQILTSWISTSNGQISLWDEHGLHLIDLPVVAQKLYLAGSRLVVAGTFGVSELLWQLPTPQLVGITNNSNAVVVTTEEGLAISEGSNLARLSSETANWWSTATVGAFNGAKRVGNGWLVYRQGTSGGLTQLALDGQPFHRLNHPWSQTTSPVRAVWLSPVENWVLVRTSSGSGNLNLYRSSDLENWTRVTLPAQPTYALPIDQARQLPASSLVWLTGVLTVPPKIINAETGYLEDETGGIQIFLDSTQGVLPSTRNQRVDLEGTVSSSQTKKINLASAQDWQTGSVVDWLWPKLELSKLQLNLGRTSQLEGRVTKLDTGSLTLTTSGQELKIHYPNSKSRWQLDDVISLPVVTDYNSSSGKNEGWWLGLGEQLINRIETSQAPGVVATPTTQTATKAVTSQPSRPATTSTAKTTSPDVQPPASRAVMVKASSLDQPDKPTNQEVPAALPAVLSFLAGASTMTGRRWRNILG